MKADSFLGARLPQRLAHAEVADDAEKQESEAQRSRTSVTVNP